MVIILSFKVIDLEGLYFCRVHTMSEMFMGLKMGSRFRIATIYRYLPVFEILKIVATFFNNFFEFKIRNI